MKTTEARQTNAAGYLILPKEFTRKGFTYRQIYREKNIAIYEQLKGGSRVSFEVIRISKHDAYSLGGNEIAARETYPGDEAWGIDAFTVMTLERAKEIASGL